MIQALTWERGGQLPKGVTWHKDHFEPQGAEKTQRREEFSALFLRSPKGRPHLPPRPSLPGRMDVSTQDPARP